MIADSVGTMGHRARDRRRAVPRFCRWSARVWAQFGHTLEAGRYLLEVRQRPRAIEVGFGRIVEPEIREPVLAGHRWNPVLLETRGRVWPGVDVHRTIRVLAQVHARGAIGDLLFVQDER